MVAPDAVQQAILNLLTNAMKHCGDAREIDLRVLARNGEAIEMTRKEFAILRFLAAHPNEVVSRDDLLNEVLAGLRAKLERDSSQPVHIKTVHGIGYKFIP